MDSAITTADAPIPDEDVRIAHADGWSFGVHGRGSGTPVVLLHGLLTDSRVWDPVVDDLSRDHLTLAVDAPGHGASPARTAPYTLDDEVAGLAAAVDDLVGGEPAVWVGHSMGGMKAMRMALDHPRLVRGLVLVSTQPYEEPPSSAEPYLAMVETIRTYGMSDDLAQIVGRLNFHKTFLATPDAQRWIAHFRRLTADRIEHACVSVYRRDDVSGRLPEITVPVLVVHGAADVPIRVRVARRYSRLLPKARLVELPDTGHTPPCERPAELAALVRDFIDALETPRP